MQGRGEPRSLDRELELAIGRKQEGKDPKTPQSAGVDTALQCWQAAMKRQKQLPKPGHAFGCWSDILPDPSWLSTGNTTT